MSQLYGGPECRVILGSVAMAVLVTLDGRIHDPEAPLLHADDLAAVRGDGVFETLLVRDGRRLPARGPPGSGSRSRRG